MTDPRVTRAYAPSRFGQLHYRIASPVEGLGAPHQHSSPSDQTMIAIAAARARAYDPGKSLQPERRP